MINLLKKINIWFASKKSTINSIRYFLMILVVSCVAYYIAPPLLGIVFVMLYCLYEKY